MEMQQEHSQTEMVKQGFIYVSGEVILYTIKDISRKTGLGIKTVEKLFDDPGFASIDFGRRKLIENHALMKFFSVRRDKVTKTFRVKLNRNPWGDDVYDDWFQDFSDEYIRRRKKVDEFELNWLDAAAMYTSPHAVFFTEEDIMEQSNWTEEEVKLLFQDPRFPRTEIGNKKIVEMHALIQFFARKALAKQDQLLERDRREFIFTHLANNKSGR